MNRLVKQFLTQYLDVTDGEVEDVLQLGEIRNFDRRTIVIHEGEVEEYFNFVYRGLVRKFFVSNEEEVVTQIACEGEIISAADSFLSGRPTHYFIETIEPTTFFSISKEKIEELYKRDKKWQLLGRQILTQILSDIERWEIDRVKLSTKERFLVFRQKYQHLFYRVPQKYLASYLNIQPETFSRLKQSLNVTS